MSTWAQQLRMLLAEISLALSPWRLQQLKPVPLQAIPMGDPLSPVLHPLLVLLLRHQPVTRLRPCRKVALLSHQGPQKVASRVGMSRLFTLPAAMDFRQPQGNVVFSSTLSPSFRSVRWLIEFCIRQKTKSVRRLTSGLVSQGRCKAAIPRVFLGAFRNQQREWHVGAIGVQEFNRFLHEGPDAMSSVEVFAPRFSTIKGPFLDMSDAVSAEQDQALRAWFEAALVDQHPQGMSTTPRRSKRNRPVALCASPIERAVLQKKQPQRSRTKSHPDSSEDDHEEEVSKHAAPTKRVKRRSRALAAATPEAAIAPSVAPSVAPSIVITPIKKNASSSSSSSNSSNDSVEVLQARYGWVHDEEMRMEGERAMKMRLFNEEARNQHLKSLKQKRKKRRKRK